MNNPLRNNFKLSSADRLLPEEKQEKIRFKMAEAAKESAHRLAEQKYSYPKTKDEWWAIVDKYWPDLILIAQKYIDLDEAIDLDGDMSPNSLLFEATEDKDHRDSKLSSFFQIVWESAPDNGSIHGNKSWNVLCDLCSESFLLFEDDQNH